MRLHDSSASGYGAALMPSTTLVTGAAGFIGSHLVDRLLEQGERVLAIDNFDPFYPVEIKRENVREHVRSSNYELVAIDIRDRTAMLGIFERFRPRRVVHLAARAGVRPSMSDPFEYVTTNVDGTLNVLEAARRTATEIVVNGSSSSVYGTMPTVPFREDARLDHLISPYAASKAAAEALCQAYVGGLGVAIVSLRFFTVYGPRQRPDLAIRKFHELIRREQTLPIYGDGTSSRDYTFVGDIVTGILSALELRPTKHEIVNLGGSSPVELRELIRTLERVMGQSARLEYLPPQLGDVPSTWADVSRARELLGYAPSTSLLEGLGPTVRWLDAELGATRRATAS